MPFFQCPSCNAQVQVAEDFAGKLVVCPQCQQSAPVPTNADATPQGITTPELVRSPLRRFEDECAEALPSILDPCPRRGLFARLPVGKALSGVGVGAVTVTLVGFLIIEVKKVRDSAARTQDIGNIFCVALAMHSFHDTHRRFPFNGSHHSVDDQRYLGVAQAKDPRSGSWLFQILPFVDQAEIFENPQLGRARPVAIFLSPGRGRPGIEDGGGVWSDYFYNNYLNNPKEASKPNAADVRRHFKDITDGASNTIMIGQGSIDTRQYRATAHVTFCSNIFVGGTAGTMRAGENGERSPAGITLRRDTAEAPSMGSWGSPWPQGVLICMVDGAARFFPYQTENFSDFLTPTGNEAVVCPE